MILRCKEENVLDGSKVFEFTLHKEYEFIWVDDPEGWEVFDDKGYKEVFFNPYIMFEKI